MYNRHTKQIRCVDCVHCDTKNKKCYPESEDAVKSEYDLEDEDIYKYRDNDCDFYNC